MLVKKDLIIFLVEFLSHSSPIFISIQSLEYAVEDMIEDKELSEEEQKGLRLILENDSEHLLLKECIWPCFKYYILPYLIKD